MKKFWLVLLAVVLILLAACSEEPVENTGEPTPGITPTPQTSQAVPESDEPDVESAPTGPLNPLTGLPIEEEQVEARPVAIMLNNLKDALPQQGNADADIIYEVVTEGGITRMLGVYQSVEGVGTIGSIRSAREYYIDIALGHDAIYIHAGGSTQAYEDLEDLNVDHMDGVRGKYSYADSGLFWRDRERIEGKYFDFEHSLVASGESIMNTLKESGMRLLHEDGFEFSLLFSEDGTPNGGERAMRLEVPFSNYKTGIFQYDESQKLYLVEEYGNEYVDGNTGEQIAVTNVLVLQTKITNTGDQYGHVNVELGGGNGWFACGGKIVPITWEKKDRFDQFRYYTLEGELLVLGQGKTYVNIISDQKEIIFE